MTADRSPESQRDAPSPPRPLLLLDVDGVLNPFAAENCPEGYREFAFFPDEEPVRLRPAHGPWLADLGRHFELVWATGWGDEANIHIAPVLALPPLPFVRFPPIPFDPAEKVPAIEAHVGTERPVAWVDDRHTPEALTWMRARPAPTLLLPADPAVGLTSAMVAELLAWRATL